MLDDIFDDTNWTLDLLEAALHYVELGWPVLPLAPHSKVPVTEHGVKDASTEPAHIKAWWKRNPKYNIGLATGVKFDVIDIDGKQGEEWWKPYAEKYSDTLRVQTVRGSHWYFQAFSDRNRIKIVEQVDLKSTGGYVVAPPSVSTDGTRYKWIQPPLPGFSLLHLTDELPDNSNVIQFPTKAARQTECPDELFTARFMKDWAVCVQDVGEATKGERNKKLYSNSVYLWEWWWRGEVSEQGVMMGMHDAAIHAGLDEEEVQRTIASAKKRAIEKMRSKAVKRG